VNLTQATIDQIKKMFPNFAFVFEDDAGGFGQDLLDLLVRATLDPNFTADRFDAEVKQTRYYNETADAAKAFDKQTQAERNADIEKLLAEITDAYGDAFDSPQTARTVASRAARLGLTGNRLRNFVYAEATKMAPAGTRAPTLESADADALRTTVREYGYMPSDDEIMSVLTGQPDRKGMVLNQNALVDRAKNSAKALYPHLSQQLDAGLSLDDLFRNYRRYASAILELDENQIDFVKDPKWARAFGTSDKGPMSLADWERELKTNQDYGWRFTNQANQQVSSVVSTLERAFGLVR
jgi:hypothetical protein